MSDAKTSKLYAHLAEEYPKIAKYVDYVSKHYPDDIEAIAENKLLAAAAISPEYSNTQLEEMVDKIAIFNGWTKWLPQEKK